ncbi:hypothetical protein AX17_003262 [Amanita inopinata Kibby_2008]|nr:hypothetical protein AX17_003262 [Amanita inopinata Kibby_2008]
MPEPKRIPPHEKLPVEIMQLVFQLCTDTDEYNFSMPFVPRQPVIAICRVCSTWRIVALDTPELWTSVSIQISGDDSVNYLRVDAARTIFSRAIRHKDGGDDDHPNPPLSLGIATHRRTPSGKGMLPFYDLIASYTFQKLDIDFPRWEQVQILWRLPNEIWSSVEQLQLRYYRLPASQDECPPLFASGINFASLKALEVPGHWNGLHPEAKIPWHQLTYLLLLPPMLASQCLDILRHATLLVSCSLRVAKSTGSTSWHDQATTTITVPDLESLKLDFTEGNDAKPFIDCLSLPNLVTLAIYDLTNPHNCDVKALAELSRRSGGLNHLELLTLGHKETDLDLDLLLSSMPALARLTQGERRWILR